jgi:RNA polymerase sigma-54 factor
MALQLKQSLNLSQQLIMTPQLQQAIRLLQLSRLELLETIAQEVESNPLLDEEPSEDNEEESPVDETREEIYEDQPLPEVSIAENLNGDMDWETYFSEYNPAWTEGPRETKESLAIENMNSQKSDLHSHLLWQLGMTNLNDRQREIGIQIIGNLDDDGYLKISIEDLTQITAFQHEEILKTLRSIQTFDPVGVAARDMQECLLIQARFANMMGTVVEKIIRHHMDNLEHKRYDRIARSLSLSMEEVLSAVSTITNFEPKPGRLYNNDNTVYISPDIYVFKVGENYEIALNEDGMPKLRINNYYKEILNRKDSLEKGTKEYIQEKLRSAAWLIKSILQRQRTIYKVTETIVQFQRDFFDKGVTHLRPLVLRDVAEHIQMHESTISRVTTNKYVHTPQGVFELKYFFNSAINSIEGESVASESVKERIRSIIKSEDKKKPYNDQEVADILKKHNICVARRTVAKYREGLGILPSRKRRKPY